jgi:hypothetical protein
MLSRRSPAAIANPSLAQAPSPARLTPEQQLCGPLRSTRTSSGSALLTRKSRPRPMPSLLGHGQRRSRFTRAAFSPATFSLAIRKQDKPAYHLFATIICPLFTSLLAASEQAAKLAGIPPKEARRRMVPIVRQTLSNYEKMGAAAAFTGPFVRGDVDTVRMHLKALAHSSGLRSVYTALAEAALQNLPHHNAKQMRAALRN